MLGVCYYPEQWDESLWSLDAQEMKKLGVTYVRLAEFSWSKLEPSPSQYNFNWLDSVIDVLAKENLKIVLCTPTATPPKWLIDQHPDILPVDINTGNIRGFGSRRHYDFSSSVYYDASMQITEIMTLRYANHPAVVGWQTDNELACHDTTHSGSDNAKKAFQIWCFEHYGTIQNLNKQWGTIFWSMEYQNFEQIELPILAVTETNPSHQLAYRRFSSDQVIRYHNDMINIIRQNCPLHFVTHNFIPITDTQCDNFALADKLDFAAYDNYPLGRTDLFFNNESSKSFRRYMRTGHPDFASCSFDQIRGISHDHFWIMEQQPGPVNWGGHNPRPEKGMVRLWSWEAVSHGASTMCYFRWRQTAFAQEQMHAGIKRVDNSPSAAWYEISQFRDELATTGFDLTASVDSIVAIIMDTQNQWVTEIERQGDSFNQQAVEFQYYSVLRGLGLNVDFVSQDSDLSQYKLVVAPCVPIIHDNLISQAITHDFHLVAGPRSGAKTDELQLYPSLGPGKLQQLIPIKVLTTETLRADIKETINYKESQFVSVKWNEELEVGADINVLAYFNNNLNRPIIVNNERVTYIGTLTEDDCLTYLFESICETLDINTVRLPEHLRVSLRGKFGVIVNYSNEIQHFPIDKMKLKNLDFVLGSKDIAPFGVSIFKEI